MKDLDEYSDFELLKEFAETQQIWTALSKSYVNYTEVEELTSRHLDKLHDQIVARVAELENEEK